MCCSALRTGIQAKKKNRGRKGMETSCVEVVFSIYCKSAGDSLDKFGNYIAILEKTLVIKMKSDISHFNK